MLLIISHKTQEVVFSHKIGVPFNFQDTVNNIRKERWKSELYIRAYGHEVDFLYQKGILQNNGEKIVQKKMMIHEIIAMMSRFNEATETYLVA